MYTEYKKLYAESQIELADVKIQLEGLQARCYQFMQLNGNAEHFRGILPTYVRVEDPEKNL